MHPDFNDVSGYFNYIDSWKVLLIHTCRVAPRLRILRVHLPMLFFTNNFNQLGRFLLKLSALVEWGFTGLLPGMSKDCRFIVNVRYIIPAEEVVSS